MSTLNLSDVTKFGETEEVAVKAYCKEYNIPRMYKVNDTNYFSARTPQEDMALFNSPHVHKVVLIYDQGVTVNQLKVDREA